jgi:hypothetical protein
LNVFTFKIEIGNEDVIVEIEETEQDGVGDRILDEDPRKGKKWLAWWSDRGEGWDDEKECDKENMCRPTLFLLIPHSFSNCP